MTLLELMAEATALAMVHGGERPVVWVDPATQQAHAVTLKPAIGPARVYFEVVLAPTPQPVEQG